MPNTIDRVTFRKNGTDTTYRISNCVEGYYNSTDGKFYVESTFTTEIPGVETLIYVDLETSYLYIYNSSAFVQVGGGGASGHTILPTPSSSVTESDVVTAVNAALPASENIASLYGVQNWSNTMEYTIPYSGTISSGATGIGTWQNSFNNPTAADEAGWGWWYDDMFKIPNLGTSDNVEVKLLYDPALSNKRPVINGGYQLDTTTGYLCVKFAAPVSGSNNKVFAKIIITRNNFS